MDLTSEIAQIKKINQELLELLDRIVRKQVEYERLARLFEQKQQPPERAHRDSQESLQTANDERLWLRVKDICRSKKNPNSLLPISAANWYRGIQEGRFPKPMKLGRSSLWKLEDIKRIVVR
jgi:prophage regulatory protein